MFDIFVFIEEFAKFWLEAFYLLGLELIFFLVFDGFELVSFKLFFYALVLGFKGGVDTLELLLSLVYASNVLIHVHW